MKTHLKENKIALEFWEGVLRRMHVVFVTATARLVWTVLEFQTGELRWMHVVYVAVMALPVMAPINAQRHFGKM